MDSVVVAVGECLDILVPIAMVVPLVATKPSQGLPIVASRLSAGQRVIGARNVFSDIYHMADRRKNFDGKGLPLSVVTVYGALYLKIYSSANVRVAVCASLLHIGTTCVKFLKRSVITGRNIQLLIARWRGPNISTPIDTNSSLPGNSCIVFVRLDICDRFLAQSGYLLAVLVTSEDIHGQ